MAKIPFTKLGLLKNQETKILKWNDLDIEIKQYLSVNEKLQLISNVINQSHDVESNFSNPTKVKIYTTLEIIFNYTNINFTEKQKEDICKLYDLIIGSKLYQQILELIPTEEYDDLIVSIETSIKAVYDYQNSVMGILDTISSDYSGLNLDASEIQAKLADPDNMELLKNILTKLG